MNEESSRSCGPTDEELVLQSRMGNIPAFERLVEWYFGFVRSVAYVRMRNRETSEDLAQQVFLRAFLHLGELRDPGRFAAWIGQVTRNLAFHWQRKHRKHSSLISLVPVEALKSDAVDTQTTEARKAMEIRESTQILRNALFKLPAEQAEVVLLRFGEGIKPPEIARRLDLHATTVRRRLKEALSAMKNRMPFTLQEVAPLMLQSHEGAIRTIRLLNAVAVLSPREGSDLGMLSAGGSEKGVWGTAMPLRSFYYWAYQTTPGRIIMSDKVGEMPFDITLETSGPDSEAKYPAMQALLARETGLTARWETREMDGYILSAPRPDPPGFRAPEPLPPGWYSFMRLNSTEGSECRNSKLTCLVIHIEENLGCPVVDETRLAGQYDWDIQWRKGATAKEITHAVRKVGLEMTQGRRQLRMLVLEGQD